MKDKTFVGAWSTLAMVLLGAAACSDDGSVEADCASYADDASSFFITFRVTNFSDAFLALESATGCNDDPFILHVSEGTTPLNIQNGPCGSCAAEQDGPEDCTLQCAQPPLVVLPPGASFDLSWDGLHWIDKSMPGECIEDGMTTGNVDCRQHTRANEGTHEISVRAFTQCTLDEEPDCGCVGSSPCVLPDGTGAELSGAVERTISFETTASQVVEITFQ